MEPIKRQWQDMVLVKISSVPGFSTWLRGKTMPIIDGDEAPFDWAYAEDYERFIKELRRKLDIK